MSFGLSILYIAEKHTEAMLDIGISSLGLMWGGWKGIKVVLFIIDLYTGPEKDRMRIREMKKIGLWREETTRDVTISDVPELLKELHLMRNRRKRNDGG